MAARNLAQGPYGGRCELVKQPMGTVYHSFWGLIVLYVLVFPIRKTSVCVLKVYSPGSFMLPSYTRWERPLIEGYFA